MQARGDFIEIKVFSRTMFEKNVIAVNGVKRLIKLYAKEDNWHRLDIGTGNLGYGWVHYGLIRAGRPKRVLCIGSQYGFIPSVCAVACRDNHCGKVDFVDAGYDLNDPNDDNSWRSGGVGFWKKVEPQRHFAKMGLDTYIKTYVTTSQDFYDKHAKKTWQYIYVDGDHSYKGVKNDFENFWPRLTLGGMMSFHDINVKRFAGLKIEIWKLWREIKASGAHNTIEIEGKFGLGIIQK